ncbi:MAG: hypothetical protein V3W11_07495 [bacterium]
MAENDLKGPEGVPEGLEELRELIAASERKGIDVGEAWRLYNEAEADAEKAPLLIERATVYLYRMKRLRTVSAVALLATVLVSIAAVSLGVAGRVVGLFGYEIKYIEFVVGVPLAAVAVALGLAWRFWGGFFKVRAGVPGLPEKVPADTEGLRSLIIEQERRGVNVDEAWRLYWKAAECEPKDKAEHQKKVPCYIEQAYNELSRKRYLKGVTRAAFASAVTFLVFAGVTAIVIWQYEIYETLFQIIAGAAALAALVSLGAWATFLWRISRIRSCDLLRPEDGPETADDLAPIIGRCEAEGINVKDAWDLHAQAKKAREEEGKEANDLIARAYADLVRKEVLLNTSRHAFAVVCIAFIALMGLLVTLVWFNKEIEKGYILSVPVFIVAWGFVGSISYVLISIYGKIQEKAFDWYDLPGYIYRIALGGVLAGVAFYLVQFGITSLPGVAGEKANIAVAGSSTIVDFRDDYFKMRDIETELAKLNAVIAGFNKPENATNANTAAEFLIESAGIWERESKVISSRKVKREHEAWKEAQVDSAAARDDLTAYVEAIEKYLNDEKSRIEKEEKEEVTLTDLLDAYNRTATDFEKRAGYLLDPEKGLLKVWDNEIKKPGGKGYIGSKTLRKALDNFEKKQAKLREAADRLKSYFVTIKDQVRTPLEEKKGRTEKELAGQKKKFERWCLVVESAGLMAKKDRLTEERDVLKSEVKEINGLISSARDQKKEEKVKERKGELASKKAELASKNDELETCEKELREALTRDLANPVWMAPVFIVFAFVAGYNVEFITKLLEKVQEVALAGGEKKPEEGTKGNSKPA